MSRTLRLPFAVAVLLLVGSVTAGAAPLGPSGRKLGAGSALVGTCGALGSATVTYNARSSTLLGLTVRNLPSTCNGARLWATASNAAGADLGHGGPITVASGTAAVTLTANPATSTVTTVRIALVGP